MIISAIRRFSGICAALIGFIVLIFWSAEVPTRSWYGEAWIEMNPLTAVTFVTAGVFLWLRYEGRKDWTRWTLPAVVAAAGFFRCAAWLGFDLELDRFLFRSSLAQNRMAPNTGMAFMIFGLGALAIDLNWPKKWLRLSEVCALWVLIFGFFTLTGYAYSAAILTGIRNEIPMALHAGMGFMAIGVGLLISAENSQFVRLLTSNHLGGRMARSVLPAIVLIPFSVGWFRIVGENQGLYSRVDGTAVFVLLIIITLFFLTWVVARKMDLADVDASKQSRILEMILENMSDGIVVCDAQRKFTHYNLAANELAGMDLAAKDMERWYQEYGSFLPDKITPVPRDRTPLFQAIQGTSVDDFVQYIRHPGRAEGVFLSTSARPIIADDGSIWGGVATLKDVTQQLKLESDLRKSKVDLEGLVDQRMKELRESEAQVRQLQKMDAVGTLAGGVAHDFNNILGAIQLYCDIIIDNPQSHPSVIETVRNVRQAAQRGAGLTRQLLIFSRKQVYQPKIIDLGDIVSQLLKMLRRMVPENIQIRPVLATGLSQVRVDPGQIEQVILNLVLNAHDAIQGNGKVIEPQYGTITIETANVDLDQTFVTKHLKTQPGRHVMLSVTDTGCGMSQEVQARLFEPFFTTKEVGKGTGLGLSTVYGIIKQSNGTIWVYSEVGRGSVFKVFLPIADESNLVPEPISSETASFSGTETILVVEDEEELRNLVVAVLKKGGHQVYWARDGKEALEVLKARESEIHLMITDILMPNLTGVDLVRIAREKIPELKVLFMSGYPNAAPDEIVGEVKDNVAFIQKPFDTQSLLKKVREMLN